MTVARDAYTTALTNVNTSDTVSHVPVGTPRGILVVVVQRATLDDTITGITYGGTAMVEMTGSPYIGTNSEAAVIYAYFLGSSVPTGTQDAVLSYSAQRGRHIGIFSLTGAADLEENAIEQLFDVESQDDPSATFAIDSVESFVMEAFMSGASAIGNVSPNTGWTAESEGDLGSLVSGIYSYDTIGTADVTVGYTSSFAENVHLVAVAISEVVGGGPTSIAPLRRRIMGELK